MFRIAVISPILVWSPAVRDNCDRAKRESRLQEDERA